MTTSTIAAGWFLFAGALMSLGALVVWVCCSEWAESRARKAERIIGVPVFRESLTASQSAALAVHTDAAVARLQMVADADLLARPGFSLRVPLQREGGEWS